MFHSPRPIPMVIDTLRLLGIFSNRPKRFFIVPLRASLLLVKAIPTDRRTATTHQPFNHISTRPTLHTRRPCSRRRFAEMFPSYHLLVIQRMEKNRRPSRVEKGAFALCSASFVVTSSAENNGGERYPMIQSITRFCPGFFALSSRPLLSLGVSLMFAQFF